MHTLTRLIVAAALAAALPAQDYDLRLDPRDRVVAGNSDLKLTLTVDVRKDTEVPAVLLSGLALETKIGGNPGPLLADDQPGRVKLTAGTKVLRLLTVPSARLSLPASSDLLDVTLSWQGMASATAVVKIAPDAGNFTLDQLDLTKTKVLLLTNHGQMVVRFFPDKAPGHVQNFVKLAKEHFYDGTKFHRIIQGFMIQGGCPNTKEGASGQPGTGNSGTFLKAEFNDTKHDRGILSMARSASPDSASTQFFVLHGRAPHLDNQYSAFGILESGFDTLDKIAGVRVRMNEMGEPSVPVEPVLLYSAIVLPVLKQ
jgi:peptidyl-prolyl cis-trans isomerase B (cyclophilin B)